MGQELGFYLGCLEVWALLSHKFPDKFSARYDPSLFRSIPARAQKSIQTLRSTIQEFVFDPEQAIMYTIDNIRNKFRLLATQCGMENPYSNNNSTGVDLSF